ncbi:MAG TPA: NYN domain-containing protein [Planctomycetota bacterium]|nr:NYN domain-containing protein [Planctomycetota bacterium]
MRYLLDGYNLAHWLAQDDDLRPEQLRALLLAKLRPKVPRNARDVVIYWDVRGREPGVMERESLPWCTLRYVSSADQAILDAVYDAENPREITVVSRDREVTGKSRQLGARVLSPAELLGR